MASFPALRLAALITMLAATLHAQTAAPKPFAPKGNLAYGDDPTEFRWSDTGVKKYSFRLSYDTGSVLTDEVTAPRKTTIGNLQPGRYTWQVRNGPLTDSNPNPWCEPVAIAVLPATPQPVAPTGWVDKASVKNLKFEFDCESNAQINRFTVELFGEAGRLGAVNADGFHVNKEIMSAYWSGWLPKGVYQWRVRSTRLPWLGTKILHGKWSAKKSFSIGVPGVPVITNPPPDTVRLPGNQVVPFGWNPLQGATQFDFKLLLNGSVVHSGLGYADTQIILARDYTPGYYSFVVAGTNAYGRGPWSQPRTFLVRRLMAPDEHTVLDAPPASLNFIRSDPATRYAVKLFKYDVAAGQYKLHKSAELPQNAGGGLVWNTPAGWYTDGSYKWTVTDYDGEKKLYTSTAFFSIRVPPAPRPLAPKGTVYGHSQIDFVWEAAQAAKQHQVQVWRDGKKVADSSWKGKEAADKAGPVLQTFDLPVEPIGAYTWRVRASNVYGPGAWRQQKVQIGPLRAPTITIPDNGTVFAPGDWIETRWKTMPNATRYKVEVWENGVFDHDNELPVTAGSTQFYHILAGPGTTVIKVRAGDIGWGPWAKRTVSRTD